MRYILLIICAIINLLIVMEQMEIIIRDVFMKGLKDRAAEVIAEAETTGNRRYLPGLLSQLLDF